MNIDELFKKIATGNGVSSAPISYIVAGLGNPGDRKSVV